MEITLTNEVTLYYEVMGSGPNLIMLHGNGEDHTIFQPLADKLANHYTVYLIDSRNHGRSSHTKQFTYEDMAEDIDLFINALFSQEVSILGFSDGAIIGTILGISQKSYINKLILLGVNLTPYDIKSDVRADLKRMHKANPEDPLLSLMLNGPNLKITDLERIEASVLVVAGDHDIMTPDQYKDIQQAIPKSELLIVPQADHMSYIEKNDYLFEDVHNFLNN